jgi:hypothetical protein
MASVINLVETGGRRVTPKRQSRLAGPTVAKIGHPEVVCPGTVTTGCRRQASVTAILWARVHFQTWHSLCGDFSAKKRLRNLKHK